MSMSNLVGRVCKRGCPKSFICKGVCSTYPAIAGFPTQHVLEEIDYQWNKRLLPKIFLTIHRNPIYRAVMGENIQARIVRRCIFSSILSKKRINNMKMKNSGSNKTYSISFMWEEGFFFIEKRIFFNQK